MGGCLPIIAWADCITVTIGRPRATAFPPSLIYICAPFRRKRHGVEWLGPKAPVGHRKPLLVKCSSKFRLGGETNPATFRGTTFGRGTALIPLSTETTRKSFPQIPHVPRGSITAGR